MNYAYGIRNGQRIPIQAQITQGDDHRVLCIRKEDCKGFEEIYVLGDYFSGSGEGCLVVPSFYPASVVMPFVEGEDFEKKSLPVLSMLGIISPERRSVGIIEGMRYEMLLHYEKSGDVFSASFYFEPGSAGEDPYEDITVRLYDLGENADYNDMAAIYRELKYGEGLKGINQRSDAVRYCAEAPEIRIRMGWKPVPCEVEYQTVENEPEMHVAVTFEMVDELMERMHACGIEKAEICLVGWNKSGHDGRWPQIFPVEERLGGIEGLRRTIACAKRLGYKIVPHLNYCDAYTIADCYDESKMVLLKDGTRKAITKAYWSGGLSKHFCATPALEHAEETLPLVAELGFEGLTYIDVLSITRPYYCLDKEHHSNRRQTAESWKKMLVSAGEHTGGSASEGSVDLVAEAIDFVLYDGFKKFSIGLDEERFKMIPMFALVYHGAITYCPSSDLVNVGILDKYKMLKFIEFGGRPAMYIFSRFVSTSDGNWMGEDDLELGTPEKLERTVEAIKRTVDFYEPIKALQSKKMMEHKVIEKDRVRVTYEGGERVYVNYSDAEWVVDGITVGAMDYRVI